MKPSLIMLIGVPASGKTTWLSKNMPVAPNGKPYHILSTDNFIEEAAKAAGKTYNEIFADTIGAATKDFGERLNSLVAQGENIIIDQTNLTEKSRASKLAAAKKAGYLLSAVLFDTHPVVVNERHEQRRVATGKNIPLHIRGSMERSLQFPDEGEGFAEITIVKVTKA